jgi:4-diphosphocytidyl-2C-methyl-D-erythritol kinase
MTGSGSVIFGLAEDEPHARRLAERLAQSAPDLWVRAARALPAEE